MRTSEILDRIKNQGFKYSTKSGLTVAVRDALIPENKQELIAQADEKVAQIKRQYDRGLISDDVRYDRVIKVWNDTTEMVKKELSTTFGERTRSICLQIPVREALWSRSVSWQVCAD